jgi:hypothetical protein
MPELLTPYMPYTTSLHEAVWKEIFYICETYSKDGDIVDPVELLRYITEHINLPKRENGTIMPGRECLVVTKRSAYDQRWRACDCSSADIFGCNMHKYYQIFHSSLCKLGHKLWSSNYDDTSPLEPNVEFVVGSNTNPLTWLKMKEILRIYVKDASSFRDSVLSLNLSPSDLNTRLELNWSIVTCLRDELEGYTPELRRWKETMGILKSRYLYGKNIFIVRNGNIELKKRTHGFRYLLYYWRDLMIEKVFEEDSDEEEESDEELEQTRPEPRPEPQPEENICETLKNIQSILDEDVKEKVPEGVYLELMNNLKKVYDKSV